MSCWELWFAAGIKRGRAVLALVAAVTGLVLAPGVAGASTTHDLSGSWSASGDGGFAGQTWNVTSMDCSSGSLSGNGSGNGYTWPISGSANGNSVSLTTGPYDQLTSYTATESGTISSDGNTMAGTWMDNNGAHGNWSATRISGPNGGANCGGGGALRPTATGVVCNYVSATSVDECTATVADSGSPPQTTPTGRVSFTSTGGGVFDVGSTCSLQASPSAPAAPSCTVEYLPTDPSRVPHVTATYAGDAHHAGSSGSTKFLTPGSVSGVGVTSAGPGQLPEGVNVTVNSPAAGSLVTVCALAPGAGAVVGRAAQSPDPQFTQLEAAFYAALATAATQLADNAPRSATMARLSSYVQQETQQYIKDQSDSLYTKRNLREIQAALHGETEDLKKLMDGACKPNQQITVPKPVTGRSVDQRQRLQPLQVAVTSRKRKVIHVHHQILAARQIVRAKAGPVTIKLKLNKPTLKRLMRTHRKVTLLIPITTVAPSGIVKSGIPTVVIVRITLVRPAGHRR